MKNCLILIDTSVWIDTLSKNAEESLKITLETLLFEQRIVRQLR